VLCSWEAVSAQQFQEVRALLMRDGLFANIVYIWWLMVVLNSTMHWPAKRDVLPVAQPACVAGACLVRTMHVHT
jgi:hypothetical protein